MPLAAVAPAAGANSSESNVPAQQALAAVLGVPHPGNPLQSGHVLGPLTSSSTERVNMVLQAAQAAQQTAGFPAVTGSKPPEHLHLGLGAASRSNHHQLSVLPASAAEVPDQLPPWHASGTAVLPPQQLFGPQAAAYLPMGLAANPQLNATPGVVPQCPVAQPALWGCSPAGFGLGSVMDATPGMLTQLTSASWAGGAPSCGCSAAAG